MIITVNEYTDTFFLMGLALLYEMYAYLTLRVELACSFCVIACLKDISSSVSLEHHLKIRGESLASYVIMVQSNKLVHAKTHDRIKCQLYHFLKLKV